MKTLMTFAILIWVQTGAVGQANLDSLLGVWKDDRQPDTTRASALDKFLWADEFLLQNPDSAIYYVNMLQQFAKENKMSKYIAKSQTALGAMAYKKGEYDKALDHYTSSLKIEQNIQDHRSACNSMSRIGTIHKNLGQLKNAERYLFDSKSLADSIGYNRGSAVASSNLAQLLLNEGKFDEALERFTEALQIFIKEQDTLFISKTLSNIGIIHLNQGNGDKALHAYMESLRYSKLFKDTQSMVSVYTNICIYYYYSGNLDSAYFYIDEAVEIAPLSGELGGQARVYTTAGSIALERGDIKTAMNHYGRSLNIFEKLKDPEGVAEVFGNISVLHRYQKDFTEAIRYADKSLEIYEELGYEREMAHVLNGIGATLLDMAEYDKSLEYLQRALAINQTVGHPRGQAINLNNIGSVYQHQKEFDLAIESYMMSIEKRKEAGDNLNIGYSYNNLADIYFETGQIDLARNYALKALDAGEKAEIIINIKDAALFLYRISKSKGDLPQALEMYELYIQMRDSIASEENIKELARFEFKYEYEKKALADSLQTLAHMESLSLNHQLEVAQKETERNFYASGGLVLLLVTVFFFQRRANRNKLLLKEKETEYQREVLYATINSQESERRRIARDLHDEVGAMLSTIKLNLGAVEMQLKQAGMSEQLTSPARNLVDETISNVRGISKNLLPPTLEEFGLAHALNDLADKVEEASGISFKKDIQPLSQRLPIEHELALFRVIQEMINNALKHAEANEFTLTMHEQNGQLKLSFADNGKGFDLEAIKKSKSGKTGLGLKNLENRVGVAGGEIEFKAAPGKGTELNVWVPLAFQQEWAA